MNCVAWNTEHQDYCTRHPETIKPFFFSIVFASVMPCMSVWIDFKACKAFYVPIPWEREHGGSPSLFDAGLCVITDLWISTEEGNEWEVDLVTIIAHCRNLTLIFHLISDVWGPTEEQHKKSHLDSSVLCCTPPASGLCKVFPIICKCVRRKHSIVTQL